jgi:alpha-mannosidase
MKVVVRRVCHASGIERLVVTRAFDGCRLVVEAIVAPGVPFVRCRVLLDNRLEDHRLRLRFPTGAPITSYDAATTFDAAHRTTQPVNDTGWAHPAPRTFIHQGWIAANELVVGAPGLPEAEVTADGDILVTLVRSVGALARLELRTRPVPAAPEMSAPGAQVQGPLDAAITLAAHPDDARAAEVGLRGVLGGDAPRLDGSLLALDARHSYVSACKPSGDAIVVRVCNPSDERDDVRLRVGFDLAGVQAVRLDETPVDQPVVLTDRSVSMTVPPHALRSCAVFPSPAKENGVRT